MVLISKNEKNGCGGYWPSTWLKMTLLGVFDSFCNWKVLSLLPNNSINCAIWVITVILRYYSNICLTADLLLNNPFWFTLVSSCFSWQIGGKGRLCSKYITFHLLSRLTKSFNLNKNGGFVQKPRSCWNRNLDKE